MNVYLIFFGSEEKTGQVYPSPVLEFESQEKLDEWLKRGGQNYMDEFARTNAELHGGWPTWHMISHGDNDDPDEILDEWLEE
jgi:hypothetical protein